MIDKSEIGSTVFAWSLVSIAACLAIIMMTATATLVFWVLKLYLGMGCGC